MQERSRKNCWFHNYEISNRFPRTPEMIEDGEYYNYGTFCTRCWKKHPGNPEKGTPSPWSAAFILIGLIALLFLK